MNYVICTLCLGLLTNTIPFAQEAVVKGRIIDSNSSEPIPKVEVHIRGSNYETTTNATGKFHISGTELPKGEQVLIISKSGYLSQSIQILIQNGSIANLDPILMEIDLSEVEARIGIISLSDNELDQDVGTSYTVSGLLQASNDVFLNAAAFDFSATFFRPRGFDNAYGKVLINGIEMNKLSTGRPQWANWGGLNDLQRNREFATGLTANDHAFGGIAGTTNMVMRASQYRRGGRISYASANRTYTGRVMGSYSSGLMKNGWAYTVLASRRYGNTGFIEGTLYDANSFFASVEKKLNSGHSLNISAFYTPNRRGRSTAVTAEVKELKGTTYNPNWGYQDGKIRNSRIREVKEPVVMLNHYWDLSERAHLNTNIAYQFGTIGDTRLDYGGNRNPAGNYYQRLPSYFLRGEHPTPHDYQLAYLAEHEFIRGGQLHWDSFYSANAASADGNASYVIQTDQSNETQLSFNTILSTRLSEAIGFNGTFSYRSLQSEHFAVLTDLLGGNGYLDIDTFGNDPVQIQNDLQHPDRIVQEGSRYKYNYQLTAGVLSGFAQVQGNYKKIDLFAGLKASQTTYQRTGLFRNGYFPEEGRSLGASEEISFTTYGIKAGGTYKVTGRHLVAINAGYLTKAPALRNVFANARQNNDLVMGVSEEKIQSADLSYIYRSPLVKARLTGYYTGIKDKADIGFFFTQNALGNEEANAFVQEIVTGIETRSIGIEFGIEAQVLPTFKLKAATAIGEHIYNNDPSLYLSGDDFDDPATSHLEGNDIFNQGVRKVHLKNYHVAAGPERAYQIGFEYRDPEFWWIGLTGNYFSNAYIDISNLRRTSDFHTDLDGSPINGYDENIARELLRQEVLDSYLLVNVIGGKSWRVKRYYIGFFASINNALDREYRTGGFEDSRRASYLQQLEEKERPHGPLFGNRYFFGYGTTYYLNVYIRF